MTRVIRELDRCIFCGCSDMSDEHLIADWANRAFAKARKPTGHLHGALIGQGQMRIDGGDPVAAAKVVCTACNSGWLSVIDNAASKVLRPLVRGDREVTLDRAGQTAVAAWIYKCALILDAADHGDDGEMAVLREGLMTSRQAGPGCVICAGPASLPPSVTVGDPPTTVNLWMLGVRAITGRMRLHINIVKDDGTVHRAEPTTHDVPGYQVMVGALWAYLGGPIPPVAPEALEGFEQVWPALDEPVTIRPASLVTRGRDAA